MWIFIPGAFVSIVEHRDDPNRVLVRARRREDLARFFLDRRVPPIIALDDADYPFRVTELRVVVSSLVEQHAYAIDYDNFKAAPPNAKRQGMLHRVWAAVRDWGAGRPASFDAEDAELLARD